MLGLTTLLWGLSYSIQAISAKDLGPFTTVFFKGFGGLFLLPLMIAQKKRITKREIIGGILMGFFSFAGCLLQQLGIIYSTISKASFITALYIVFVPLIEIFLGQKVNRRIWISVSVAIPGLYLLCMHSSGNINTGDLFLLIGSVMFAFQIILIDRFSRTCDPLVLTFVSQTSVAFFSFIVMVFKESVNLSAIVRSFFAIFFIVFIGGLLAQCIQIRYQRDLDSSLASLLMSFESVFGALFGWLILHQVMSMREIFGCVLVFIAILIAEMK